MDDKAAKEADARRTDEIDANVQRLLKEATKVPMYDWELRAEVDRQRDLWYKEAMVLSGQVASMKRALHAICAMYPHTSVAGDMMSRIAHEALDIPYEQGLDSRSDLGDNPVTASK
jgi:hypothetical protein